jgi:hypothetical protein
MDDPGGGRGHDDAGTRGVAECVPPADQPMADAAAAADLVASPPLTAAQRA